MKEGKRRRSVRYQTYVRRKVTFIGFGLILIIFLFLISISVGAVHIPLSSVMTILVNGTGTTLYERIIWNIRMPQTLAAIVAGAGLATAGVVMQSILRNPLASPFTLGLSNAAAFGAAVGIVLFGAGTTGSSIADAVVVKNPYITTICAFIFSMLTTVIILLIARMRGSTPETMILAGVAVSSLFAAGLMAIQYFADDTKLASIVFWQFGDVSRADWNELTLITVVIIICFLYIFYHRWDYNAIDSGEETARGLGVNLELIRMGGMIAASLISAVIVSFLGVIGFIGLVCPHMMRRFIGDDHRYLIPGSFVCGAVLLLVSDTIGRVIISPHVLPVSVITAFLGAPVFIYLIVRRRWM